MNQHIEYVRNLSDDQIKQLIKDYVALSKTGVLPPNSYFKEVCTNICDMLKINFNLRILDEILKMEIYERFIIK